MNQFNLQTKGDVFFGAGLSLEQVQHWNKVQSIYSKDNFIFVEYPYDLNHTNIWKCYLEYSGSADLRINKKSLSFDGDQTNAELQKEFIDRESYRNTYWDTFMQHVKWSGYYIPVDDFSYFTTLEMESELYHNYLLSRHFKVNDYFTNIKRDSIEKQWKSVPIAAMGIWQYLVFYANFLYSCHSDELVVSKPIPKWHTRNISFKKFHIHFPSRQITSLLMLTIEQGYNPKINSAKYNRLLNLAHKSVKSFFKKYAGNINSWINEQEGVLFDEEMKADFISCCKEDFKIITAIELIHNTDIDYFESFLLNQLIKRAKNDSRKSFLNKIRDTLSRQTLASILWIVSNETSTKPKRYIPKKMKTNIHTKTPWYDIDENLIDEIEECIEGLPDKFKVNLNNIISKKWVTHMVNVANTFCPPVVIWKIVENQTIPQWNILDNNSASKYQNAFYKKQESIAQQKQRFKNYVFKLKKLKTLPEIANFTTEIIEFIDPTLKLKWQQEVNQHTQATKGRQEYRDRRMVELGITGNDKPKDFRTEIWLDEMLQIEEEIRSFIPFVKKAFNAALPIRKTIEFNTDRHDVSGIEFDPTTINDQNKWLRGEVMKTMKSKTKLGEIEQINAFCLDYSGSMNHTRMRNLFKVLYLLVLGLEDRKSYDAFHFFNSNFIEGSNFSEKFTQRSLLFNILSKISVITKGEVEYSGYIGTNIGEGVLECHTRIHSFKEKMMLKKPASNFVCSMFVITDGEPSVGIIDLDELNDFIQEKRDDGDIPIKGIYIKSEEDENNFMESIFGEDEFVETVEFGEAVNKFVSIMTQTYKEQRKAQKWKSRRESIKGNN